MVRNGGGHIGGDCVMAQRDDEKLDKEVEKLSVNGLRKHLDKVLSEIQKRRENQPPDPTSSVQGLAEAGYIDVALNLYRKQNPEVSKSDAERVVRKYAPSDSKK
jgi:hypothetical protein